MNALPKGWTVSALLDVAELHDNRRVPLNAAERAKRRGAFPYYGANGLVDHIDSYIFNGDYVLLAEDGGNFDKPERGVAYEVSGKFWVNNHAHIVRPRNGMSTRFLCYWLNAIDWMPHVGGTTRAKLTQAGMSQVEIPVPPQAEQTAISEALDRNCDRLKAASAELEKANRLIARYRSVILASEFNGENTSSWKEDCLEKFVIEGLAGLVRSKSAQNFESGTPYIRMNHYDLVGRWNTDKMSYVNITDAEFRRFALRNDDIVFNTRNSTELVGKVAIWQNGNNTHVYNNNLLRIRFKKNVIPEYAAYYMNSPQFRVYLESVKSATTSVAAIYQRDLYAAKMRIPPIQKQQEIVSRIKKAFAWISKLEREWSNTNVLIPKLDNAILRKAFRGGVSRGSD